MALRIVIGSGVSEKIKKMKRPFTLLLFSNNPPFVAEAVHAGIGRIMIDWEHIGKETRQAFSDTEINHHTVDDLRRVRACTPAPITCRINQVGAETRDEIEQAIAAGANEIMLPMVRGRAEVERVLEQVNGRCQVGILVETVAAVNQAEELARLPLSCVYVGLNDLAIERRTANIFTPLIDGTLAKVRRAFQIPFGFGGLTLPDCGAPIPCHLLIKEMVRLGCDFAFLRRSFHRDIQGRNLTVEVPRLLAALQTAENRAPEIVQADNAELSRVIRNLNGALPVARKSFAGVSAYE